MSAAKITMMANQIAAFFKSKPEDQAIEGIADHINKFWERRMRAEFFGIMEKDAEQFHPLVQQAAKTIKKP